MKHLPLLLLATSSVIPAIVAPAQNACAQQVEAPAMSLGEKQLLEVAAHGKMNAFIDSTNLTPYQSETKIAFQKSANNMLVLMAQEQHLSSLDLNPTTLLFWNEPESVDIAKKVAQGQGFGLEAGTLPLESVMADLNDYVVANFKPDADFGRYSFSYAKLPANLQQQLAAHFLARIMAETPPSFNELWLGEALWSKSNIYFVPAQPNFTGSKQSLLLSCKLQTAEENYELRFDLRRGGSSSSPLKTYLPDAALLPAQFKVLPLEDGFDENKPAAIPGNFHAAGSAAKALSPFLNTILSPDLALNGLKLAASVELKPARLPITEFIAQLAVDSENRLIVSSEVREKNYYITAVTGGMPAAEVMRAVARLYDLHWEVAPTGSYTLKPNTRSEFDTQLLRTGNFSWYRFREWNTGYLGQYDEAFDKLIAKVIEEGGPNIKQAPGVPFGNLPATTQATLREGVQQGMARNVLRTQVEVLPYLESEWSFSFDPAQSQLKLLLNGTPKQVLSIIPRRRHNFRAVPTPT